MVCFIVFVRMRCEVLWSMVVRNSMLSICGLEWVVFFVIKEKGSLVLVVCLVELVVILIICSGFYFSRICWMGDVLRNV